MTRAAELRRVPPSPHRGTAASKRRRPRVPPPAPPSGAISCAPDACLRGAQRGDGRRRSLDAHMTRRGHHVRADFARRRDPPFARAQGRSAASRAAAARAPGAPGTRASWRAAAGISSAAAAASPRGLERAPGSRTGRGRATDPAAAPTSRPVDAGLARARERRADPLPGGRQGDAGARRSSPCRYRTGARPEGSARVDPGHGRRDAARARVTHRARSRC